MTVEYSLTDAEHLPYVKHGLLQVQREARGDGGFEARLAEAAARPGWTAAIGYENGEAVGYCHGFSLARDTDWWSSGPVVPLQGYVTWETGRRTAVLEEIAVRAPWRGTGVAAQLHAVWLSVRPEERVALLVDPAAGGGALRAACEAWGYRRVADRRESRGSTVYTTMIRPVRRP